MGQSGFRELGSYEYKPGEGNSNIFSTDGLSFDWKIQHGAGVVTVSISAEMDVLTFVFRGFKGPSTFKYNILVGDLDMSQSNGMTGGIRYQGKSDTVLGFFQSKDIAITNIADLKWTARIEWSSFVGDKPVTVSISITPGLTQTTIPLNTM